MKRKYALWIMCLFVCLSLGACASTGKTQTQTVIDTTYQALKVAADGYNLTDAALKTPAVQVLLTPALKQQIYVAQLAYYTAYQASVQALVAYSSVSNADTDAKLSTAVAQMKTALNVFTILAKPYLPQAGGV